VAVIAQAAALVFRNPDPSPGPGGSGTASGGPGGSGLPQSAPPTSGPLNASEIELQASLPLLDSVTGPCTRWLTPPNGTDVLSPSGYAKSTARLSCPGPDGDAHKVEYARYESLENLDADFASIMANEGLAESGDCAEATPANALWFFPDQPPSGHLACFERGGGVEWVWTQNQLRLLAQWQAPDNASGRAFWLSWTKTRNADEQELESRLPASMLAVGSCNRAADRYWQQARAILVCPRADKFNQYFALFDESDAFPDDAMTRQALQLLAAGGFPEDTATGCYQSLPGRYRWYFEGNDAPQGYLGCYVPAGATDSRVQFIWTYNRTAVMGWWTAPDMTTGIDFVRAYNSAALSITP
jgi:hypothetical protein